MLNLLNRNKGNSPTTPVDNKGKVKDAKLSSKKKSSSSGSLVGEGKAVKAKKSGAKNGIKANKPSSGGKKNKTKKDDKKPSKPLSSGSLDRGLMMKSNNSHSPSKPSKRVRPAKADDFVKKPPARHRSLEDLMGIQSVVGKFESETAQNRAANSKLAEMSKRSSCGSNVRIRSLNDGRGRGGGDGLDTRSEHTRRSRSSSRGRPINGRGGGRNAGLDSKSDHRPRSMSRGPKGNRGRGGGPGGLDSKSEHIRRDKTPLSRRAACDRPPSTPSRSKSLESNEAFELSPISALEKRSQEKKETVELKKQVDELQGQLQSLERQNKALQTVNDNLQSKLRIQKLDHERLVDERDKEIKELNDTVEKIMVVPSGGRSSSLFGGGKTGGSSDDDLSKIKEEKNQLEIKYKVSEDNLQKQKDDYESKMTFKDETIDHLMKELARMKQKGSSIDGSEHGRKAPGRTSSGIANLRVADMGERTGSFGNLANYASAAWDKMSPGALRDQNRHQRLSREERKRMGVTAL